MSTKLWYLVEIDHASDIMEGKFAPEPDADECTNKFLTFLSKRRKLTTFSAGVLREYFILFWKGSREKTSSSLSRRNFEHYKEASRSNIIS